MRRTAAQRIYSAVRDRFWEELSRGRHAAQGPRDGDTPDFAEVRRAAQAPPQPRVVEADPPPLDALDAAEGAELAVPFATESAAPAAAAQEGAALPGVPWGFSIDLVVDEPLTRADVAHALTHAQGPQPRPGMVFSPAAAPVPGQWSVGPDGCFCPGSRSGQRVKSFALRSPRLAWGPAGAGAVLDAFALLRRSEIGARVDPSGGLAVRLCAHRFGTGELAAAAENWLRLEPALESLVCLDARWAPWAAPPMREQLLLEDIGLAARRGVQGVAELVTPPGRPARLGMGSLLTAAVGDAGRREELQVSLHHAVFCPYAVLCWGGLMQLLLCAAVSRARQPPALRPGLPEAGAEWQALRGELLGRTPALAAYFATRRTELLRLHTAYARNWLDHCQGQSLQLPEPGEAALVPRAGPLNPLRELQRCSTPNGELAFYSGPRHLVAPRDKRWREAFPVPMIAPVRTVDSDPLSVPAAGSPRQQGVLAGGPRLHDASVPAREEVFNRARNLHYVPEADPQDPLPDTNAGGRTYY
eukprot:TRINITY_DN9431_c0_g5_i1.p1 TRINITY_DN9431_c0_g5~~TRINITY_DN9431_c0_g5_i1.p1  ORF type:complete len:551 (+),score=165.00 TRINITY_DN9431_c0_g5_i1:68-1654(+)